VNVGPDPLERVQMVRFRVQGRLNPEPDVYYANKIVKRYSIILLEGKDRKVCPDVRATLRAPKHTVQRWHGLATPTDSHGQSNRVGHLRRWGRSCPARVLSHRGRQKARSGKGEGDAVRGNAETSTPRVGLDKGWGSL